MDVFLNKVITIYDGIHNPGTNTGRKPILL